MRAAQLTRLEGPDAVEVGEIDEPAGDGVVVEVHAAGAAFPDALSSAQITIPLCANRFQSRREGDSLLRHV